MTGWVENPFSTHSQPRMPGREKGFSHQHRELNGPSGPAVSRA